MDNMERLRQVQQAVAQLEKWQRIGLVLSPASLKALGKELYEQAQQLRQAMDNEETRALLKQARSHAYGFQSFSFNVSVFPGHTSYGTTVWVSLEDLRLRVSRLHSLERLMKAELLALPRLDEDKFHVLVDATGARTLAGIAAASRMLYPEGTCLTILIEDLVRFGAGSGEVLFSREMLDRAQKRARLVPES